jgi:hypothetical protein
MARHLAITADILARDLTNALTLRDSSTAKQTLQALRAEPNVTVACIYAPDGEVLAFYLRDSTRAITPCQPAVMPTLTGERDQLVEIRKIQTSGV